MKIRVLLVALAMSALSINSVGAVSLKSPVISTIHSPSGAVVLEHFLRVPVGAKREHFDPA
jgi:hypothetical protein